MQFVRLNCSRCIEKSHFGAVTFGKRVICILMFRKFERAQIGEGVRWLTLLTELIFDGMIVVLLGFSLKHFEFPPLKKT